MEVGHESDCFVAFAELEGRKELGDPVGGSGEEAESDEDGSAAEEAGELALVSPVQEEENEEPEQVDFGGAEGEGDAGEQGAGCAVAEGDSDGEEEERDVLCDGEAGEEGEAPGGGEKFGLSRLTGPDCDGREEGSEAEGLPEPVGGDVRELGKGPKERGLPGEADKNQVFGGVAGDAGFGGDEGGGIVELAGAGEFSGGVKIEEIVDADGGGGSESRSVPGSGEGNTGETGEGESGAGHGLVVWSWVLGDAILQR